MTKRVREFTDKERLDWLERQKEDISFCIDTESKDYRFIVYFYDGNGNDGVWRKTARQAIDAAIRAQRKEDKRLTK